MWLKIKNYTQLTTVINISTANSLIIINLISELAVDFFYRKL